LIAEIKPYAEYKESGLPWAGLVPREWTLQKIREVATVVNGYPFDSRLFSLTAGRPLIRIRDINKAVTAARYDGQFVETARVTPGDLLIGMDGDFNVGRWLGTEPALLNQRVCAVRSRTKLMDKYLSYALPHPLQVINDLTYATTVKHLSSSQVERISFAIPSMKEQDAIVRFLEWSNRHLEQSIHAKQKMIALIREQMQVIIHGAVAKGLDPTVPLKPSGLTWLGDIPEHWGIVRNLALFSQTVEPGIPGLPVLQVSLHTGITVEGNDQLGRHKRQLKDVTKYKLVRAGELAYNTMRMWQGAVGVAPTDGCVSSAYVTFKPRDGVQPKYHEYLFRTADYKHQINCYSTGITPHRNRLYWESFKQMPNIQLPFDEQQRIVEFIESETHTLTIAINRLKREIELIREYRTRLVADVVNGKLDVREVAEHLPVESIEPTDIILDTDELANAPELDEEEV
jgi:type I restriction enzyme S subunit